MNVQHACRCYHPAPQPSPQPPPAEQPGTQPAPLPAAVKQATTLVASFSYSYSASFSQAYVSAASQREALDGTAGQGGSKTAETAAAQPKTFDLSALQFGVSFMGSYAAVRQESVVSAGQGAADPQPAEADRSEAPAPAKVLTGTVRAALRPEPAPAAEAGAGSLPAAGTSGPSSVPAGGDAADGSGQSEKPAIERAEPGEFRKFRLKQFQASTETSLKLELETREGDRIVLDFSQIESLSRTRFRGRDDDGGRVRFHETAESLQRLVDIEISGDISEEERAAIDAVFDRVLEVANSFFGGSTKAALDKVRDMEIDTDTLLDFSLSMSQKHSIEATRAYRNTDAGMERLASRDVEVSRTLEYLGESQRALVAEAREVLDDRSATKMVRSLLPAMLKESMLEESMVDKSLLEQPEQELAQAAAKETRAEPAASAEEPAAA